jgi:hypothetical protein
MAIVTVPKNARLLLILQDGVDGKGNPRLVNRTLGKVKTGVLPQDLYDVANAISGLQTLTFAGVQESLVNELNVQ